MIDGNPLTDLISVPSERVDSWRWATVTGANPLRVRLDGDVNPLDATPDSLVACAVGDRVRCHIYNRRVTVVGVKDTGDPNTIIVNGKRYVSTGIENVPNHTLTAWHDLWISPDLNSSVPVPPGYRLMVQITPVSSYAAVSMVGTTSYRYFTTNNMPASQILWTLIKNARI